MLRKMTDRCPFSYIALRYKQEDIMNKEIFSPSLGIGILKKNIEKGTDKEYLLIDFVNIQ